MPTVQGFPEASAAISQPAYDCDPELLPEDWWQWLLEDVHELER